jgi:hypothetical protein
MNNQEITTGSVYNQYDRIIRCVERWVASVNPRIVGCEDAQTRARIVQRIVEKTSDGYTRYVIDNALKTISQPSAKYIAGGLSVCLSTGKVSISLHQWFKELYHFTASWLYYLIVLVIGIKYKSPKLSLAATFLMEPGAGYEKYNSRFVNFCRKGPIEPLSSVKQIIVKTKTQPDYSADHNFFYTPHPILFFANHLLGRVARVSIVLQHLTAPFYFIKALVSCSLNALLGSDLSGIQCYRFLNKKNLIDSIIITTSSFTSQPLWMKGLIDAKYKLHMIWYSQNCVPKMYAGEVEKSNLPQTRHMRVDVHWVWTEGFKSYLRELGQSSEIKVVGPILWYLPDRIKDHGSSHYKIAIFDVTPSHEKIMPFGAFKNYYSVKTIKQFVIDIVDIGQKFAALSGKDILFLLKHKRDPKSGFHDFTYFSFLEQFAISNHNFKIIDNQTNVFGLLDECDFSISVPYTSVPYVASSMQKPAIYYDPFDELIPNYEKNEFVSFASGKEQLKKTMNNLLFLGNDKAPPHRSTKNHS